MDKEFVPYQPSLDMKELGFDEPCFGSYVKLTETQNTFFMNDVVSEIDRETPLHESLITKAPTYSQGFRFFREKYGLFVAPNVISYEDGPYLWFFEINSTVSPFGTDLGGTDDFETYEEAELACLIKLIEIVKRSKNE